MVVILEWKGRQCTVYMYIYRIPTYALLFYDFLNQRFLTVAIFYEIHVFWLPYGFQKVHVAVAVDNCWSFRIINQSQQCTCYQRLVTWCKIIIHLTHLNMVEPALRVTSLLQLPKQLPRTCTFYVVILRPPVARSGHLTTSLFSRYANPIRVV